MLHHAVSYSNHYVFYVFLMVIHRVPSFRAQVSVDEPFQKPKGPFGSQAIAVRPGHPRRLEEFVLGTVFHVDLGTANRHRKGWNGPK